jgi:hypothetical protein
MQVGARFIRATGVRVRPTPRAASPERHLVLVYRPGWQSLDDLNAIARHVTELDPAVGVFIVSGLSRNTVTRKKAATRPSLIVSPGIIPSFRPVRGKVYQGKPIPKAEEVRRLAAAGVPVPRTAILTPDLVIDPAEWGEFVIVKPTDILSSSHGHGIQLKRASRVRFIPPNGYPPSHPGRWGPMMVQQYISTGDLLTTYRVLTLFGEPLYAQLNVGAGPNLSPTASDDEIERANVALQSASGRADRLAHESDILAVARAAYRAVPEVPLQGCDILREAGTGALYVIELNCGGNTWHFSSAYSESARQEYGDEYQLLRRQQFDAMRTAARVLVERVKSEAV